ncbi:MAG: LVIVD repeat-containing protein [Carbonactinosporaceae bacterium]
MHDLPRTPNGDRATTARPPRLPFRPRVIGIGALIVVLAGLVVAPAQSDEGAKAQSPAADQRNMQLVGTDDLQARSAYQPLIDFNAAADRWIAYVGHHDGTAVNPLTGEEEPNGTSIVDVTDPQRPRYLHHIPGPAPDGGAQMARVCDGSDLPDGAPGKEYLLRTLGNEAHEIWDVTDPAAPELVSTIGEGLNGTHKNWWECDTGIAYLMSGAPGWRTERMTQVYDISDPANPVHIRDFGLVGQQPGSTGPVPTEGHGPISLDGRVYFGYGTEAGGIMQIVDRDTLVNGDPEPTPENLLAPQISRLDLCTFCGGAHTTFPVLDVPIREFAHFPSGSTRDIVVIVNETGANFCAAPDPGPEMVYLADITDPAKPQIISNYHVDERSGHFCERGGRFGAHSSNENMTPIYYKKLVFISYFNAGVRAVDIRNPFQPQEVAHFIPAITENTDERCGTLNGQERCATVIQTNNVEVDDRGFIYIVDRANTGMHILKLTGSALRIVEE